MNTVEKFSLESSLKIDKPFIHEAYYPLLFDKYITFNISHSQQSRKWDFFTECINILSPYLERHNIKVLQLGEHGDPIIHGAYNISGSTSPAQCSYVLKRSMLHFGANGFLSYLSAYHHKPTVALYSDVTPQTDKPLWGSSDKTICLEPTISSKPTYSREENPKSINTIPPEKVASHILDLLDIEHSLNELDPFYVGDQYFTNVFEVVPDFVPHPSFLPNTLINVRMDYHFNEDNLMPLAQNRKLSIIMDKPINLEKLKLIKPSLNHFFYFVNEESDATYLHELRRIGIGVTLLSKNSKNLSKIRLHLIDMVVDEVISKTREKIDTAQKVCDNTYYKSSKALYSQGNEYSSKAAWKRGVKAQKEQKIIDCPEFWEEIDSFKLYNKNDSNQKASNGKQ